MTSKRSPLMPQGTAVWLVENTSLTFEQIADFCDLHILEVTGIANGDVLEVQGVNPILNNEVTKEEIERCQKDATSSLVFSDVVTEIDVVLNKGKSKRKYVYLNSRQNKLNAILWLVDNCPELSKAQIRKLVGTTNKTIDDIRNKYDIQPKDPVLSNVCTQADLNLEIEKAAKVAAKKEKKNTEKGKAKK
jgi:hypothetical protein